MRKSVFFCFCLALILGSRVFAVDASQAVIIDWQGSEFSSQPMPKWLESLFFRKKSGPFCKEFNLDKKQILYCGRGRSRDLDEALLEAKSSALTKSVEEGMKAAASSDLRKVADYWIEFQEDGVIFYEAFCVYTSGQRLRQRQR